MKLLLSALALCVALTAPAAPPRLEKQGTTQQLIVDGKPFLILGGELGNSTLASRGAGRMSRFRPLIMEDGTVSDTPAKTTIGGFEITATFIDPWTPRADQAIANHGALVIYAGGEDSWFSGQAVTFTFRGTGEGPPLVGIDVAEEGVFDAQGKWQSGRRLNGDQTHQGRHIRLSPGAPQIQRVRLYRYP